MTRTYDVPDMSCGHCQEAIERSLIAMTPLTESDLEVDLGTKTVTVTAEVPDKEIRAAIDEAGYDVAGVR